MMIFLDPKSPQPFKYPLLSELFAFLGSKDQIPDWFSSYVLNDGLSLFIKFFAKQLKTSHSILAVNVVLQCLCLQEDRRASLFAEIFPSLVFSENVGKPGLFQLAKTVSEGGYCIMLAHYVDAITRYVVCSDPHRVSLLKHWLIKEQLLSDKLEVWERVFSSYSEAEVMSTIQELNDMKNQLSSFLSEINDSKGYCRLVSYLELKFGVYSCIVDLFSICHRMPLKSGRNNRSFIVVKAQELVVRSMCV
jgi:hypothetical protein